MLQDVNLPVYSLLIHNLCNHTFTNMNKGFKSFKGLRLEMSALKLTLQLSIYIMTSVDKTKLFCYAFMYIGQETYNVLYSVIMLEIWGCGLYTSFCGNETN